VQPVAADATILGVWSATLTLGLFHDLPVSDRNRTHNKSNVKKTNKPTSSSSTATPNHQPKQLIEMAGLEIRRRALSKELAHVNGEMSRLNLEIRVLGIEIPWLARGRRGGIR
jgi:hypothetical protein